MSDISISVVYLAASRERVGLEREVIHVNQEATLQELKRLLFNRHPQLKSIAPYLRWALNHTFVDDDQVGLSEGCEVALIPPISGG